MANGVDPPKSGVSSESTTSAPNWQTSMMNVNSNQYKSTLDKSKPKPVNTSISVVGNTPTSVQAAPVSGIHNVKASVDSWKSETAKEKARWNALTDDQKQEETNKKIEEQKAQERERYIRNFNAGYGGITTGAANLALGSGEEGEIAGGFLPGLGEVIDAKNTVQDLSVGDYGGAAMNAAGFLLPFVPGKAIKKLFRGAEDALYPTTVYRQALTDPNVARTSYKGSESAVAKKVREKGDFYTDNYAESEFYGRGDLGNRGIRQGDDITITEAKLPFWMKDTRYDADVQKLKKAQGGAQPGEYIVPNKGFSSMFIKKREFPVKGLPSHIENTSKDLRPISDNSSFFTHTKPGQYVMDQQKGARSFFGIKE